MDNKDLVGLPFFTRNGLNQQAIQQVLVPMDLQSMVNRLNDVAYNNPEYQLDYYNNINDTLSLSDSNVLSTKSLESVVTDRKDAFIYTLGQILYNHWLYMTATDLYKAQVYITLPRDSSSISLTSQQAVGLYLYATHLYYRGSDTVKKILATTIPRIRVERVVNNSFNRDAIIAGIEKEFISIKEVDEILDTNTKLSAFYSIPDFKDLCNTIFINSYVQSVLYSTKTNSYARAYAQYVATNLYCDQTVELSQLKINNRRMKYKELLDSINVDLTDYSSDNLLSLINNIKEVAAGISTKDTNTLSVVQQAMTSLLAKLSSYSINILTSINEDPIRIVPNIAVRVYYIRNNPIIEEYIYSAPIHVLKETAIENIYVEIRDKDIFGIFKLVNKHYSTNDFEIGIKPTLQVDKNVNRLSNHDCGIFVTPDKTQEELFSSMSNADKVTIFKSGVFN